MIKIRSIPQAATPVQKTSLHRLVLPSIKFANRGPKYGEAMYSSAHNPIFRARSWKKKISLMKAMAIVWQDVIVSPCRARMA